MLQVLLTTYIPVGSATLYNARDILEKFMTKLPQQIASGSGSAKEVFKTVAKDSFDLALFNWIAVEVHYALVEIMLQHKRLKENYITEEEFDELLRIYLCSVVGGILGGTLGTSAGSGAGAVLGSYMGPPGLVLGPPLGGSCGGILGRMIGRKAGHAIGSSEFAASLARGESPSQIRSLESVINKFFNMLVLHLRVPIMVHQD